MGVRAPTGKELRFLKLLLEGTSTRKASRVLKIPERTAYNIAEKLVHLGYITPVPGTESPVLYEKGDLDYCFIEGKCKLGEGATNYTPSLSRTYRSAPDPIKGVCADKNCPENYVEAHINGAMSCTVEAVGTFDDPQIPGIGYVGYWERKMKRTNGADNQYGSITIDHQAVKFGFRKGDRGSLTFSFYPARIYVDPMEFRSQFEIKELFTDRILKVTNILKKTGWVLTNPVFDGDSTHEYAMQNSPLTQFLPHGHEKDNDIIVDGSPGCPEAEITNPDSWEKVQIFANLPTHVMQAKALAKEALEQTDEKYHTLKKRIDAVDELIERLTTTQEKLTELMTVQTENFVNFACAYKGEASCASQPDDKNMVGYQ